MSQTSPRYHDYDALRAFAMLLGIVLHGLMSFVELPPGMWPASRRRAINNHPSRGKRR